MSSKSSATPNRTGCPAARIGVGIDTSRYRPYAASLTHELQPPVAMRLQATVRQGTRVINQLHQLLALAFPELALLVKDISLGWVLELLHRYPSAALLAKASRDDLAGIPYLPDERIAPLLEHARS